MGPLPVVALQPGVQVGLQLLQAPVYLLPEEQAVAFVLQGLVEPLAYAIGLRLVGLGPGVVDVFHGQVELVGMVLRLAAVFRAPVGQDALQFDPLLIKQGNNSVIEQVRRGDGGLVSVELGSGHPAVGPYCPSGKVCW